MIRTKGEPGTGNVVEAVRHLRRVTAEVRHVVGTPEGELADLAKELRAPLDLVRKVKEMGRLPVVNFSAGGVATAADAALMMQLGADGIFVGSGVFKSQSPEKTARAIVRATLHYNDPKVIAEVSEDVGEAMPGMEMATLEPKDRMQDRGI